MLRQMKTALAAFALLTLIASVPASAATKRAGKRPTPTRPAKQQPSPTEVLVSQLFINRYQPGDNLADTCREASFKNLAIALNMNREWIARSKDEFETTEHFRQRAGKLTELLSRDSIAFCESLDDNPDMPFAYKADDQRFEGSFNSSHNVWRDVKNLGSYRSRTRMGIAATVRASAELEYDIAMSFPSELRGCLTADYSTYKYRVPLSLADAPLLKGRGRAVFIAKLESPYIHATESSGNPTLDDPYDVYTSTLTVHVKPQRLVIIDGTGKEIWSCRVGALDPLQSPQPIGDKDRWLSILDYPRGYYTDSPSGTVTAILQIGADGLVSGCEVTGTSGSPALDVATCAGWIKRSQFLPASDKEGNPISGQYTISKTWGRYGI
jgi:Gram-negative bacterial TonB protein C-terminal